MDTVVDIGRLFAWAVLTLIPPGLMALVRSQAARLPPDFVMGMIVFVLIPEVICLLGLLLWATPLVQAELEGQTWTYLAVRPRGRLKVLIGKYLTAVIWTFSAAFMSVSITVLVLLPQEILRFWAVMVALSFLSCIAYGALYALIGCLVHRRAMVFAVSYTLIFEFLVTLIPAMINQITIQFRLRNLLFLWMDWADDLPDNADVFLSDAPAIQHLILLLVATGILLGASAAAISWKEYVNSDENAA